MSEKKQVAYIYVEAANGMEVRIPADKYPEWKAAQDKLKAEGAMNILEEKAKRYLESKKKK